MDAYLDIETTGLSPGHHHVTVVGISVGDGESHNLLQLVGEQISASAVLEAVRGVDTLFTYNGARFDLPFLRSCLGVDLAQEIHHRDLMFDCWAKHLRGGLKAVERQLGIPRELVGIDGRDAVRLWRRYQNRQDIDALHLLLKYNREDVLNLKSLRTVLARYCR